MRQATFPQIVILSGKTKTNDYTNELKKDLSEYKFGASKGMSNGVTENSFMVIAPNESDIKTLLSYAQHYEQDNILVSRTDRTSYLLDSHGIKTELGVLVPVNKEIALRGENWTYIDSLDQYYVTIKGKK